MKYYVGLDVAMEETAICIVDDRRRIMRESMAASEPETIAAFPMAIGLTFERVGIEAGLLAPWLCDLLAAIPPAKAELILQATSTTIRVIRKSLQNNKRVFSMTVAVSQILL